MTWSRRLGKGKVQELKLAVGQGSNGKVVAPGGRTCSGGPNSWLALLFGYSGPSEREHSFAFATPCQSYNAAPRVT